MVTIEELDFSSTSQSPSGRFVISSTSSGLSRARGYFTAAVGHSLLPMTHIGGPGGGEGKGG